MKNSNEMGKKSGGGGNRDNADFGDRSIMLFGVVSIEKIQKILISL
jgi:hypothetical protein